jgi:uracil-DNA glycosylase
LLELKTGAFYTTDFMNQNALPVFSAECRLCERLSGFLEDVRARHPDYYARPVPSFGPQGAPLLVIGLAPGLHGANRTGRPFTGDHAGLLLYRTLHRFGFASRPESLSADDGLRLIDCRITNTVRCVPPQNKPTGPEIRTCLGYLRAELSAVPAGAALVALGSVAHAAALTASGVRAGDFRFGHAAIHRLPNGTVLFDSYHCSRYNTQTRRLTEAMFADVFAAVRNYLDGAAPESA